MAGLREAMQDAPGSKQGGFQLSSDSRKLLIRLAPLRQIEETLSKVVSGASPTPNESSQASQQRQYNSTRAPEEVSIPSGYGWKKAVLGRRSQDSPTASNTDAAELAQARRVLAACTDDIVKLWNDRTVRRALKSAEVSLEDQPGL
jgi:guanine nucleotide-binding protein subunit alpha